MPFVTTSLWAWDSALYARAVDDGLHLGVDLADQRPHAPGYPFYVFAAQALHVIAGDANAALVALSVVASALAAAAVYVVARRFADTASAAIAALAFAFAPLAWTYGEVAMPYAVLAAGSAAVAGALVWARGRGARALAASALLGLAAGFRQDLLIVLGPMWLWTLASLGWRSRLWSAAALALACVAWLAPSIAASGGLAAYADALGAQGARVETLSPLGNGAPEVTRNLALTLFGLFWGTLVAGMVLVVRGGARLRSLGRAPGSAFFALWIVPALLFYLGVHVGDPGYVLSILPAAFVLLAATIAAWPARWRYASALLVAQGVLFFVPAYPLSRDALAAHDAAVRALLATASGTPADASVVASGPAYTIAAYYVRDRPVRFVGDAPEVLSRGATTETSAPRRTTLITFAPPAVTTSTIEAGAPYPAPLHDLGLR